jgi:low affinity Fe/Cu permease
MKGSWFARFAQESAWLTGRPIAFLLAMATIIVWACLGPVFHYSDTWQLVINTGTTIVTFLMVFVIQNTQNRDTAAIHIKLDELIRVSRNARNILLDLEELDDRDLEAIRREYECLAEADLKLRRKPLTNVSREARMKSPPPQRKKPGAKRGG